MRSMEGQPRELTSDLQSAVPALNIDEYADRLLQETLSAAAVEPDAGFLPEIFTSLVAERLTIAGEFPEPESAPTEPAA